LLVYLLEDLTPLMAITPSLVEVLEMLHALYIQLYLEDVTIPFLRPVLTLLLVQEEATQPLDNIPMLEVDIIIQLLATAQQLVVDILTQLQGQFQQLAEESLTQHLLSIQPLVVDLPTKLVIPVLL